jgi:hypothetical protein
MQCAGITEHELVEVGAREGRVGTRYRCSECGTASEDRIGHAEPFDIAERDTKPDLERRKS